jgi:outer membrane lipoprotein-sorting protein
MRVVLYIFLGLLPAFCLIMPCAAAEPDMDRALNRLNALTASINSLRCDFTQTTSIPLFTAPVVSQGILLFQKPDALVWEYTAPVAQGLAFSGGKGFRWDEDKSRRTPFIIAEDPIAGLIAAQMLAWIRFDRIWIEAQYAIQVEEEEPLSLILIPKNADMRSVLASLSIRFADDGIARTILLMEASGGSTEIRFHSVVVNGAVDAGEFR